MDKKDYSKITKEDIEKTISDYFYKKKEELPKSRKTKLYIRFSSKKAAEKWFKEVWNPLLQKEFEKQIKNKFGK